MNIRREESQGYTTRFWVSSESEGDKEYLVELAAYPLGYNEHGSMRFNGACICTKSPEDQAMHGCPSFIYNQEPQLKRPDNKGKAFRCKHINFVRAYIESMSVDGMIEQLARLDPNLKDDQLP